MINVKDPEKSWLDDAFAEDAQPAQTHSPADRAPSEGFDWIDDAFDDQRTARDIQQAKGAKAPGCLLVAVLVAVVALVAFAFFGIAGALR